MGREDGISLAKIVAWLLVLFVLASGGLFMYVRWQVPLALGPATVSEELVGLEPNGLVYVATFVRNTSGLPVTLQGLGKLGETDQALLVPVDIRLGDGSSPTESGTARFTPIQLDPDSGVGVLIVYAPNPDLICKLFPEERTDETQELSTFPLRYTTYGIPQEQTLRGNEPFFTVKRPTSAQCAEALVP